jgi:Ser/Thr protein kinase RdoA (MazF antagonist)
MIVMSKQDLIEILKNYDLGEYKSHKYYKAPNCDIYFIKTTLDNFVVKFQNDNDMNEKEMEYNNKITKYLNSKGLKVQLVFRQKNGKFVLKYKERNGAVYSYLKGEKLQDNYVVKTYKGVAYNIGLMHKYLLDLDIENIGYSHCSIEKFIKDGYLNHFTEKNKKQYDSLLKNLKNINYSLLRKCVIHSDLTEINMLQDNNEFSGFIDFATAYKDYLILDLAYYIANCIIKKKWMKDFFKEYNKSVNLNEEERKSLYYFIKSKLLQKEHLAKNYPYFDKITLKEFVSITKIN